MRLRPLALLSTAIALAALAACSDKPAPSTDAGALGSAAAAPPGSSGAVTAVAPKPHVKPPTREGGALVRAAGEDALYVADEDHHVLRKIPLPVPADATALPPPIALPGPPAQVLALSDSVLVTIRGLDDPRAPKPPGLLLVFKPDAQKGLVEAARIELPADAWGLAVTPDESTALVTSAWTHQLSAVDLATAKKKWSIDLPREPRAVVVRPDGASAYVTHLVGAGITRVDNLVGPPTIHSIELPPAPARAPSGKTLDAALAYSAVLNEDGSRFFVARHALGALGQGSWFGAMTLDVMATKADTPVLAKRILGLPVAKHVILGQLVDAGLVTTLDVSATELAPVTQPRAAVYRKSSKTVLVVGEGDDRVAEFDALSAAPALRPWAVYKIGGKYEANLQIPAVGGGPSGIALSADEKQAYVFCRTTYDIATLQLADPDKPPPPAPVSPGQLRSPESPTTVTILHLADDPGDHETALGRKLYYSAIDTTVSGGLGCAGCHPEGRDDGHVWHDASVTSLNETERVIFLAEPELAPNEKNGKIGYARQTPMLAGRVFANGPYGWHAQNKDLVARLKEGFALHRWNTHHPKGEGEILARIQYIRAFAQKGLVSPPKEQRELTDEEKQGQTIFLSPAAGCGKCHVPDPEYSDRIAYPFSPKLPPLPGFEEDPKDEFKTPSLRFVGGTPPYFHDGRYSTLEQLFEQNGDRMGKTSHLGKEDRAALIAFLRTL